MAATIDGLFDSDLKEKINNCKLLVVGAGGIGCELLKNLVLSGFENIHVVDLDTIDLSNLNRQFLFHKQHIGKPKAVVAKESVLKFNPKADITAHHDSITNPKYNVEFYRQFTVVANALDNVGARSHVNRMCMAADIPLIESGSAGYLGQTTVYKRKLSECYECLPRKAPKSYPGCTIRNTPSEPVHCIVWAKHLFNQLFGEPDAEDEVSPDASAKKAPATTGGEVNMENMLEYDYQNVSFSKVNTRELAEATDYSSPVLFKKFFYQDVIYLRQMSDLWKTRRPPSPLIHDFLPDAVPGSSHFKESDIQDLRLWTVYECREVFARSMKALYQKMHEGGTKTALIWDKDDDDCLDFVAACANLRAHCFNIPMKSRFDVKAIAGNIIPAIATTNAIVAGLVVLQIFKVLRGDITKCKNSWLNETYMSTSKLISSAQLEKPNPLCLVCSSNANEVSVKVNLKSLTLRTLEDKVLKEKLHMVQPDVVINDGSGSILISSDPDDMADGMYEKTLDSFKLDSDSRLLCEDFLQNFKIDLVILQDDDLSNQDFAFTSDLDNIKPEEKEAEGNSEESEAAANNAEKDNDDIDMEIEDDCQIVLPSAPETTIKEEDENGVEPPTKKLKTETE